MARASPQLDTTDMQTPDPRPTGIIRLADHPALSPETREQLELLVHAKTGAKQDLNGFLEDLDYAARMRRGARELRQESSPRTVREQLLAVHKAFKKLSDRLNELDGKARQLLYSDSSTASRESIDTAMSHIAQGLIEASERVDGLPQTGGKPKRYEDLAMAELVAQAMERHLGEDPKMTRGGLFEQLLKTIIEALEPERDDPSVREIIRDVLNARAAGEPIVEHATRVE